MGVWPKKSKYKTSVCLENHSETAQIRKENIFCGIDKKLISYNKSIE